MKRLAISVLVAWVLFIGIDFLFHASLLAPIWAAEVPAIKSPTELFRLIPAGYASFLLQTILIGYLIYKVFPLEPALGEVARFGIIVGLLLAVSNALALFSYVAIPIQHLLLFNFVYLIEIVAIAIIFYYLLFAVRFRKVIGICILLFFVLIVAGIVIQNL